MRFNFNGILSAMVVCVALTSTSAFAHCALTDVEVQVRVPTDAGVQQIELDIQSNLNRSTKDVLYLRKNESDFVRPGLVGDSFTIQVTEIDRFKNDSFPRITAGCVSGNKVVWYGLAQFNVSWTIQ